MRPDLTAARRGPIGGRHAIAPGTAAFAMPTDAIPKAFAGKGVVAAQARPGFWGVTQGLRRLAVKIPIHQREMLCHLFSFSFAKAEYPL